jgi:hypothetical protein
MQYPKKIKKKVLLVREEVSGGSGEVVLYKSPDGQIRLDVRLEKETIWLNQKQMAKLFSTERSAITKHLRNIFKSKELDDKSNVQKLHITGTYKPITYYNLDVILSVGYRVNSKRGTQFRIWATTVLREHLVKGVTLNRQRLETNAREIEAALELARQAVATPHLTTDMGRGLVEIIARYTQTFILLQRYKDKDVLIHLTMNMLTKDVK